MNLPDLSRIVDTYVPITGNDLDVYLDQVRRDVVTSLRQLQDQDLLRWYGFLLHGADQLGGREGQSDRAYIHLFLEPRTDVEIDQFIGRLPSHFLNPIKIRPTKIAGVDVSMLKNGDWAYGWKTLGEASEWVVLLLENHGHSIPSQQIIQFLHFITNPLALGHRCIFTPGGFMPF
jgi:hypothetical protein